MRNVNATGPRASVAGLRPAFTGDPVGTTIVAADELADAVGADEPDDGVGGDEPDVDAPVVEGGVDAPRATKGTAARWMSDRPDIEITP